MNRTLITTLCGALLGATLGVWAQDPAPGDGTTTKRTFGNGVLSENVAIYDVDDDGVLSIEELQILQSERLRLRQHTTLRDRWDLNRDGRIDARERTAATARIRQLIEERRCRRFNEVDLNSDGALVLEEFLRIAAVQKADLDDPGTGTELFKHLDHDGNRRISKAEFLRSLDNLRTPPGGEEPTPKTREDRNRLDDSLR